jgi:RNA polymerase sigma-70 factor (ECF subfamily)
MELQHSVTPQADVLLPLLSLWDRLKSTADNSEASDSEDTLDLHADNGNHDGPAFEISAIAQQQPSSDRDFSAAQGEIDYLHRSDDQLLAAAKTSDERAFEMLSGRYIRSIRKRVYSIVRNSEDTEDVVQDSLLKAYRHLPEFRESYGFSKWITRIAINTALMLLRKRKARPEVSFDHVGGVGQTWGTWETADPSPDTERAYAAQEALEIMSRAVKSLPPLYRNVLEQYHVQEKSLREAADKLGITVASAKSRLFRARLALRARLEGQRISAFDACY